MCQLTVTPYRPQAVLSLSLNKTQLSLYETDTFALVCTARLGSEEVTPDSVTYASSAESVATVSGGTVTAEGVGTAEITVTAVYGGQTAESTVSVTVSEARTVLVADFGEREVLAGEPLRLSMTVMKGKEIVEDYGGVTFTLSDDTVGAVENGMFTGTQKGSTVITAKCTVEGEELSLEIPHARARAIHRHLYERRAAGRAEHRFRRRNRLPFPPPRPRPQTERSVVGYGTGRRSPPKPKCSRT